MNKKGFTIIEVVVVFLLILGLTFFILPKNLENTKHAKLISKWIAKYSELEYTFSAIRAQKDGEIKEKFQAEHNNNDRKKIIIDIIKPYLRITSEVKIPYKQSYMNGATVTSIGQYYFDDFYFTNSNEIIGLKLVNPNCDKKDVCAIVAFDINGEQIPNTWGYDIFGINIFKNGIEPLGAEVDSDILRKNCSKGGSGLYCSYYYLVGGRFD